MASERGKRKDRLLFILQYLINNTDDEHRVSQQELADLCAESGHGCDRHLLEQKYPLDLSSTALPQRGHLPIELASFDISTSESRITS